MSSPNSVAHAAHEGRYKPYPDYKDSGVEWLGEIPVHWEVRRLKHLATLNPESLMENTDPTREIVYVDIGGVDGLGRIAECERLTFASAPSRARRLVREGDVIVSTVRTYLRAIASISDPEANMVVSTGFAVVRPAGDLITEYAAYALRAPYFVERVVANSKGVSFPAINESEMATYEVAAPPQSEQRAIAAFLDRETARIDALVAKKAQLIALLQEQRTALITRAVAKGLDQDCCVSDAVSSVFPRIPVGWELRKLRRLLTRIARPVAVDPDEEYREIGIRSWGRGIFHKDAVRGVLLEDKSVYYIEPGDFVLNIVFAWEGAVAIASEAEIGMIGSHRFPTFRCSSEVDSDYLLMVLQTEQGRALMEVNSPGAAGRNKTIRLGQFLDEAIPLPPFAEQREIVRQFRIDDARLVRLLDHLKLALQRLKELRTALISAAVTGQIDVREEIT